MSPDWLRTQSAAEWGEIVSYVFLAVGTAVPVIGLLLQWSNDSTIGTSTALLLIGIAGSLAASKRKSFLTNTALTAANIKDGELQAALAIEKTKIRRQDAQMRPRRLTSEQRAGLIRALHGQAFAVEVSTLRADPEASRFHEEILQTLKRAGLEVGVFTGYEMGEGLRISGPASPEREVLVAAFEAVGLKLYPDPDGFWGQKGRLELIIGSKLPPGVG